MVKVTYYRSHISRERAKSEQGCHLGVTNCTSHMMWAWLRRKIIINPTGCPRLISIFEYMAEKKRVVSEKINWYIVHKVAVTSTNGSTDNNNRPPRNEKEQLEKELEEALEKEYDVIVIEPRSLGDDVVRWIKLGNFFHKGAVVINLSTLVLAPFLSHHLNLYALTSCGLLGVGFACIYNISWQFDPCCKYQVDWVGRQLRSIPSEELTTTTPVVIIRRNDNYRKVLHTSLAVVVIGYLGWRWYSEH